VLLLYKARSNNQLHDRLHDATLVDGGGKNLTCLILATELPADDHPTVIVSAPVMQPVV
jgi:hypothetical protein